MKSSRRGLGAVALALLLSGCSRDEEPAAAAPAPSAPPWSDATDAPVTPEPPPTVRPGAPAAALQNAPAPTGAQVPQRFHGEWNMDLSDCGTGMNDSRLVISADEVAFYESSGSITRVEQPAPDELAVTAELFGEGEGPWTNTARFRLSADGQTLTTVGEGTALMRRRCPSP